MTSIPNYQPHPSGDAVLLEALLNTADHLGLKKKELGEIIHLDDRTLRRRSGLDPESAPGQLALLLVRAYRAAFVLMGGAEGARYWFSTPNRALGGVPKILACRIDGLVRIVSYLDAMRGKV
ncbi:MbcA/ParS/Xre antitoxin family protein [Microbulbifer thermotolerans]|uniref:antitoxin Xre/MbcA/ParS toxin-binding domain-containing protein n=1 Tax=Microbulbifer thermotolerans TaxID=252514 RepID=UPI0022498A19|nr:antitoxin Xre/MbcA/ParS toxin-binding domain-containing protein [Microbulbifer thermotolerans]MCX2794496.1 MbcA/ParS/Xre antitoxin family protein [Microbulbifer thermotolerans]